MKRFSLVSKFGEIPLSGVYLLLAGWVVIILFFVHTPVKKPMVFLETGVSFYGFPNFYFFFDRTVFFPIEVTFFFKPG